MIPTPNFSKNLKQNITNPYLREIEKKKNHPSILNITVFVGYLSIAASIVNCPVPRNKLQGMKVLCN